MKRIIKKVACLVMAVTCLTTSVVTNPIPAKAADMVDFYGRKEEVNYGDLIFANNYSVDFKDYAYFRMTVPANGYISVVVDKPMMPDGTYARVKAGVLDLNNNAVWLGYKEPKNTPDSLTTYSYSVGLAAGTYYFCLEGSGNKNYSALMNFTVNFTPSETWEKEYNNTADTATPLPLNTMFTGSQDDSEGCWSKYLGSDDYYSFQVQKGSVYKIVVDNSMEIVNNDDITLIDASGKSRAVDHYTTTNGTNEEYVFVAEYTGTYYLKFYGNCARPSKLYQVGVFDYSLTAPKLNSVKAKKNKITVSYSTKSEIENYQVQYSTNKKFKKGTVRQVYTNKGNAKQVLSGLSKKKTYYIRVRSYVRTGDTTVFSKWSKVKSVKAK